MSPAARTMLVPMSMPRYITVIPERMLIFRAPYHKCQAAEIFLMNFSQHRVAFKLKTTSPELFYCNPFVGYLAPGVQIKCTIGLRSSDSAKLIAAQMHKQHAFKVYAYPVLTEEGRMAPPLSPQEFWAQPVRYVDLQWKKLVIKFTPSTSTEEGQLSPSVTKQDASTQDYEEPRHARNSYYREAPVTICGDNRQRSSFSDSNSNERGTVIESARSRATSTGPNNKDSRRRRHVSSSKTPPTSREASAEPMRFLEFDSSDQQTSFESRPMSELRSHMVEGEHAAREISPYATTLPLQGAIDGKPRPPSRYKHHGVKTNNDTRSSNSTPSNGTHRALPVTVVDYGTTLSPDTAAIIDAHKTPYYHSVEIERITEELTEEIILHKPSSGQTRPTSAQPTGMHRARRARVSPTHSLQSIEKERIEETLEYRFLPYRPKSEQDRSIYEASVMV